MPPDRTPDLLRLRATLASLDHAADQLIADRPDADMLSVITERGFLRPLENELLGFWFARYLSIRIALRELIDELIAGTGKRLPDADDYHEWCLFLVGYAAACQLVRLDRTMLFEVAVSGTLQRKLNEPFDELRIPRKQYTTLYRAFVDQRDALTIHDAIRHVRRYRRRLATLTQDTRVGDLVRDLQRRESWLDASRRRYLGRLLDYTGHKWRRKGVVALSQSLAHLMEGIGRTASGVGGRSVKRIDAATLAALTGLLEPGDVLVTRHDHALTNLFLPGFWPHVALYVGTAAQRDARGVDLDNARRERWIEDRVVLEALKDGVRFRPLAETLAVDHVLVLRPKLGRASIDRGLSRACRHEGKPYNFDFDFFNTDRLVCTEVIYRAYDGIDGMEFPLTMRAGRQTLSAEDLVGFAIASSRLQPVALLSAAFGARTLETDEASALLAIGRPPGASPEGHAGSPG